ncbi:MAG TPA: hypothetical protein VD971_11235 [Phycisphaerales bacterium]|nr:hypothetical protein [Phycisphaerales bacterium]
MAGPQRAARLSTGQVFDRRRKHGREAAEEIVRKSVFLDAAERALLLAVFERGQTAAEIARITGAKPQTVRRRIKLLVQRVDDPLFAFTAARSDAWPAPLRRVARACFVRGYSMRRASTELRMSLHTVRRHHDAVLSLYEMQHGAAVVRLAS